MNTKLILATLATTMIHAASNIQDDIWYLLSKPHSTNTFNGQPNTLHIVKFSQSVESLDALDQTENSDAPKAVGGSVANVAKASAATNGEVSPIKEAEVTQ